MEKRKRISRWILIMGIFFTLLGLVHIAATPLVIETELAGLDKGIVRVFVYMFVATGVAVVCAGLLVVYSAIGMKRAENMAWPVAVGGGLFMLLLGIGAVVMMTDNPFAYIMLVSATAEMALLWMYRRDLR